MKPSLVIGFHLTHCVAQMASTMMRHQGIYQFTRSMATPCLRLHSRTKVAAVAGSSSSSSSSSLLTSATKGGASAAIRAASLVLLLHESFKRAAGRWAPQLDLLMTLR